jgi:hypothetical protein
MAVIGLRRSRPMTVLHKAADVIGGRSADNIGGFLYAAVRACIMTFRSIPLRRQSSSNNPWPTKR